MDYPYLYETHLHTTEASACARSAAADYVALYLARGYSGIFVTDHFLWGNTNISRSLPWREQVERFCLGYEHARQAGEPLGLSVFFGMEAGFDGDEFLLYGIDKQWLLRHPDMSQWSRTRLFHEVDAVGGLVVQAHPFRERDYLSQICLYPRCCHAVEAVNSGNEPEFDARAAAYAAHWKLPVTAGSDIHACSGSRFRGMTAMAFSRRLESADAFVRAVRSEGGYTLPDFAARTGAPFRWPPELPVYLYGEEETPLPATRERIFGAQSAPCAADAEKTGFGMDRQDLF